MTPSPSAAPSWVWGGGWERHWAPHPCPGGSGSPHGAQTPQARHLAQHHDPCQVGKLRQGGPAAHSRSRLPSPGSGRHCQAGTSGATRGCQLCRGISVGQERAGGLPTPPPSLSPPTPRVRMPSRYVGVPLTVLPTALGGYPVPTLLGGSKGMLKGLGGSYTSGGGGAEGAGSPLPPPDPPLCSNGSLLAWVQAGTPQNAQRAEPPRGPTYPPITSPRVGGQGKLGDREPPPPEPLTHPWRAGPSPPPPGSAARWFWPCRRTSGWAPRSPRGGLRWVPPRWPELPPTLHHRWGCQHRPPPPPPRPLLVVASSFFLFSIVFLAASLPTCAGATTGESKRAGARGHAAVGELGWAGLVPTGPPASGW